MFPSLHQIRSHLFVSVSVCLLHANASTRSRRTGRREFGLIERRKTLLTQERHVGHEVRHRRQGMREA